MIFKKISPLEGNPMRPDGQHIVFDGLYYETENEDDIKFLQGFKQFEVVESRAEVAVAEPAPAKASTGVMTAANLAKTAAQNK